MLAGSRRKTNIGLGGGILLLFLGAGFVSAAEGDREATWSALLGLGAMLGGLALFVRGCCASAAGKGYPWAVGFVGLAGLIGLIVLAFLPDRYKCCDAAGPDCTHNVDSLRRPKDWSSRAA